MNLIKNRLYRNCLVLLRYFTSWLVAFQAPALYFRKTTKQNQAIPVKSKKFLIVANGCFLTKAIIQALATEKIIIALDGACMQLAAIDIIPHIILGDFDSIDASAAHIFGIKHIDYTSIAYQGKNDIKIVPAKDQNHTDLVKAIRYCDLHGAAQIDIVCADGGRVDHTLGNFNALRAEYKKSRPMYLHTEMQTLHYIKDDVIEICGNIGDYCAILGFPYGKFSSTGLKYDVNDYPIEPGHDSICNQLAANCARVAVTGEALIIKAFDLSVHSP